MFGQITEVGFFEKIIFFLFWGTQKNFFDPQKPYLALKTQLLGGGGVILLKLFDQSIGLEVRNYQNSHFWAKSALDISKTTAWIKTRVLGFVDSDYL